MPVWRDVSDDSSEDAGGASRLLRLTPTQRAYINCHSDFCRKIRIESFLDAWKGRFGYISDCSGMETPLLALQSIFRLRPGTIQYLSQSERDTTAMAFLQKNFPSALQQLGLDFAEHAKLCDRLLSHYSAQFDDRRMPEHVQQMRGRLPRAMGTAPDDDDIFCLVKATMSSKELCQDPLLVWPASLQSSSRDAFQGVDDPGCPIQRCELDDGRRQELRALKMALQRDFPQLHRVVAWYDSMINGDGFGERPAPLTFLREARAHRVNWSDFQLGQRAPGPRPHELQVVGQKNLGQHLQDIFGGSDRLERVKLEVSHHALQNGDWKQTKPLVFVLDNIPDPETKKDKNVKKEKDAEKPRKRAKKQKKDDLTNRNFGSYLDIGKTKSAQHISLAWRCRLLGYAIHPSGFALGDA
eukprot:Skav213092  [mRNA]  locus=scaffold512:115995:131433:- [translate_table: standard]